MAKCLRKKDVPYLYFVTVKNFVCVSLNLLKIEAFKN